VSNTDAVVKNVLQDAQTIGPRTMDTGLINGKNVGPNGAGSRFTLDTIQPGKSYRLRIINAAIQSTYKFSIDAHSFDVIANDFVPIVPYGATTLGINIGQRYDIIVHANATSGSSYWMRADNQQSCSDTIDNRNIKGIFAYSGTAMTTVAPTSVGYSYTDSCLDEPYASLVPHVKLNAGPADVVEGPLDVVLASNSAQLLKWYLSGTTFFSEYDDPTLYRIYQDNTLTNYSGPLLIPLPKRDQMIYLIIKSDLNLPHPIHLHGHDFWVLAQGQGDYSSSTPLNYNNPPRRDTATMPASGFLVLAFMTDNPGAWLAHCHIGWHSAMGFALQFAELQSEIRSSGALGDSCVLDGNCKSWRAYADVAKIEVIDSGV
jgi:FtsP/CotA-like multicopper oxidase with cupredoxin domain